MIKNHYKINFIIGKNTNNIKGDCMKKINTEAIIYIGSSSIILRICKIKKGNLYEIEYVSNNISIGKYSFNIGRIPQQIVDETCNYINNYKQLCNEYGIDRILLLASTAIRESKNSNFIIEHIFSKTHLNLKILSDFELKNTVIKTLYYELMKNDEYFDKSIMFSFIGSGNLGISFYNKKNINYIQNILIGTLKLYELTRTSSIYENKLHLLIEEHLHTYTNSLSKFFPEKSIDKFVLTGRTIEIIIKYLNKKERNNLYIINKNDFVDFYKNIVNSSLDNLSFNYEIKKDIMTELIISTVVIKNLLEYTNAHEIIIPKIFNFDILYYKHLNTKIYEDVNKLFSSFAYESAITLAKKYKCYDNHAIFVESIAVKIADKLKIKFDINTNDKLYLSIACILHNAGKYINPEKHYLNTYYIIKNTGIIGLTEKEMNIIANTAMYQGSIIPSDYDYNYANLTHKDKMTVSKLSAILKVADALDKNYLQKLQNIKISLSKNRLIFNVFTEVDTIIEQMKLSEVKEFFNEVYGLEIEINKKRKY